MAKPSTKNTPAPIDIAAYTARFNAIWHPHLLNGGREESGAQRKLWREKLYDKLAAEFPAESAAISAYRQYLSSLGISRQRPLTKADMARLTPQQLLGRKLLAALSISGRGKIPAKPATKAKKMGRPNKGQNTTVLQRYQACIDSGDWVPNDHVAAALLGCSTGHVAAVRKELEERYIFGEFKGPGGWTVGYDAKAKPQPAPQVDPAEIFERNMLVENIKARLQALKRDELTAIDELLSESLR